MNTVSMHRKYAICTQYLDSMLEHSVELLEGESKLDAYRRGFKELDQIAAELRKEASIPFMQDASYVPPASTVTTAGTEPVIIDLNHQRLRDAIDDCMCEDELKQWKDKNPAIPVPINNYYNERLKALTNGK